MSDQFPTFASPEEAAMSGFPPAHCRVVASAAEGDDGFVVLDTGAPGQPYLYAVAAWRDTAGWHEGSSGNAMGWTITDLERDLGTLAAWDYAPDNADRVRISFLSELREVPVAGGAYLTVWWRVLCPEFDDWPWPVSFRRDGVWIPADPRPDLRPWGR